MNQRLNGLHRGPTVRIACFLIQDNTKNKPDRCSEFDLCSWSINSIDHHCQSLTITWIMIFCNCIFLMFLTYLIPQKISAAKNDHTKYFWAQSAQENGSDTEENGTGSGSKIKLSYKNNLLLKSVRNAEKLNATCLGKFADH